MDYSTLKSKSLSLKQLQLELRQDLERALVLAREVEEKGSLVETWGLVMEELVKVSESAMAISSRLPISALMHKGLQ